jgi:hypothetical protein
VLITTTNVTVPDGAPVHVIVGDWLDPSQVYVSASAPLLTPPTAVSENVGGARGVPDTAADAGPVPTEFVAVMVQE